MNRTQPQTLFNKMELSFWNFAIQVLSSTKATRIQLSRLSRSVRRSESASMAILLSVCGLAGLVSGYVFYFFTLGLR